LRMVIVRMNLLDMRSTFKNIEKGGKISKKVKAGNLGPNLSLQLRVI